MLHGLMPERWITSPRSVTPRRPKSVREIYRPAVQDLSEIAARHGANYLEETILSVVTRPSTSDTYHSTSFIKPPDTVDQIKNSTAPPVSQRNSDYQEDLHRQRVLVSAHNRNKLHRIRRSKSQPLGSSSDKNNGNGQRNSNQSNEEEPEKFDLVVTNCTRNPDQLTDDTNQARRVNYRFNSRGVKPQCAHAILQSAGSPLPVLNGYHQQLLQNHPKFSRRYCQWLTNGLKVQSFKVNTSRTPVTPPRPVSLTRPRTINGRWGSRAGNLQTDFNVVGKQTAFQSHENLTQFSQKDIERYIKAE